ncbi:hypothetical protein G7066_12745 [Leucobacter coleopterorum]|uniref:Surface adhesin CshA non-repetitive domain-containing protein n=1 Tax=Leucobacter coleopterorum TaxID=2714933 RepID=A0ABX6JYC0_9MICO|nr:CshA/CshB family fibrillar adhesin-related protein [Leucobacter coleopterorum]QIM19218.1 hypothetical protein G7066_12745 [Leucobacter coleopterorum]
MESVRTNAAIDTAEGAPYTVELGNGLTLDFTLRAEAGADGKRLKWSSPLPTWEHSALGNGFYLNTPGYPALTTQLTGTSLSGEVIKYRLSDIKASLDGVPLGDDFSMVMADAEHTDAKEAFAWTADVPLEHLTEAQPDGWDQAVFQQASEPPAFGVMERLTFKKRTRVQRWCMRNTRPKSRLL